MDTESQIFEEERQRRLKNAVGVKIVIEINKQGSLSLYWSINGQEQTIHIPLRILISRWYRDMVNELPDYEYSSWNPTDEEIESLLKQEHEVPYYDN